MLKLIVNADDLGYSKGVNLGIIKAMEQGIVTSTTLLVNRQATGEAIDQIRTGQISNVGVHLCLTTGRTISDPEHIPGLVDRAGNLRGKEYMLQADLPVDQVERELRAQLEKALALGVPVTHLDSHHHVHSNPPVLAAMVRLAREYSLPVRSVNPEMTGYFREQGIKTPDIFIGDFYGEGAATKNLIKLLKEATEQLIALNEPAGNRGEGGGADGASGLSGRLPLN